MTIEVFQRNGCFGVGSIILNLGSRALKKLVGYKRNLGRSIE